VARNDKSQRTEQPTQRRIKKGREKGQVPRSKEVGLALSLGTGLLWAWLGGHRSVETLESLVRHCASAGAERDHDLLAAMTAAAWAALAALALPLLVLGASGAAASLVQTGWSPSPKALKLKFENLSPASGIKRMFSGRQLVEAAKIVLRFALFLGIALLAVRPEIMRIGEVVGRTPEGIGAALVGLTGRVLFKVLIVSILLALADHALTRRRWWRDLKMTKQEVKDERKELEGDPQIKSRIRRLMYQAARRRMLRDVSEADVVVTNPTRVAVALRYDTGRESAPRVLAKGRGQLAERIRELALEHRVPLLSDPPLARALYRLGEVGAEVPEKLYRALAEVFAWVFGRRRGERPGYRTASDLGEDGRPFAEAP
jgi:flagellar biosynthetic protein FlhB